MSKARPTKHASVESLVADIVEEVTDRLNRGEPRGPLRRIPGTARS